MRDDCTVSLLAGQGSALAMIAAYVLASELTKSVGRPETAFHRYEHLLRPFMTEKQKAAERFARSFVPKTRLGLLFRNHVTNAFTIPGIAKLAWEAACWIVLSCRYSDPHGD